MRNLLQLCSCKQASAEKHPISSTLTSESLMILNMALPNLACSAHLLGDTQPSFCSMVVLNGQHLQPCPILAELLISKAQMGALMFGMSRCIQMNSLFVFIYSHRTKDRNI